MTNLVKIKGLVRDNVQAGLQPKSFVPRGFRVPNPLGFYYDGGVKASLPIGSSTNVVTYTAKYGGSAHGAIQVAQVATGPLGVTTTYTSATANPIITVNYVPASGSTAAATGTITVSSTGPANNDTITIGGTKYTFKTTLTGAANEVKVDGSTEDLGLTNLIAALSAGAGSGSTYGTGTVANPAVTAGSVTSHVLTLTATATGAAGNSVVFTKSSANLALNGSGTLTGGTTAVPVSTAAQVAAAVNADPIASQFVTAVPGSGNATAGAAAALSTGTAGTNVGISFPTYIKVSSAGVVVIDADDPQTVRALNRNPGKWISLGSA